MSPSPLARAWLALGATLELVASAIEIGALIESAPPSRQRELSQRWLEQIAPRQPDRQHA